MGILACDVVFRMPSARLYFMSANCAIHAFRLDQRQERIKSMDFSTWTWQSSCMLLVYPSMFTYKKHSIHQNSSAMVINMVTDIKQTCLGQGLGVTFTARKHPSKLMFTMKDLGHMPPGPQNWIFASNSRCYYFKKAMQTTALINWVNLLS